jgi:hypothetical protein
MDHLGPKGSKYQISQVVWFNKIDIQIQMFMWIILILNDSSKLSLYFETKTWEHSKVEISIFTIF